MLLALDGLGDRAAAPAASARSPAADLFQDYLTTALEPGEVLTSVQRPALDGYGWGYEKFTRRAEDWAMVGVVALVKASGGTCEDVRIGLTHMGSTPLRATAAEEALRGRPARRRADRRGGRAGRRRHRAARRPERHARVQAPPRPGAHPAGARGRGGRAA